MGNYDFVCALVCVTNLTVYVFYDLACCGELKRFILPRVTLFSVKSPRFLSPLCANSLPIEFWNFIHGSMKNWRVVLLLFFSRFHARERDFSSKFPGRQSCPIICVNDKRRSPSFPSSFSPYFEAEEAPYFRWRQEKVSAPTRYG